MATTSRNTPWRREWQDGRVVVVDAEGEIVCRIEEWSEQVDQEDGDLIAAAPDMLAALFEASEALSFAMRGTSDAEQSDKYAATIAKITEAASKAGA